MSWGMPDVTTGFRPTGLDRQVAVPTTEPAGIHPAAGAGATSRASRWAPVIAMVVAAVALGLFVLYSLGYTVLFGVFPRPPLYGRWQPAFDPMALLVLPAGLVLAGVGWL